MSYIRVHTVLYGKSNRLRCYFASVITDDRRANIKFVYTVIETIN